MRGNAGVIGYAHSFDVGSVRLTERHVKTDPPSSEELEAIAEAVRRDFEPARGTKTDRVVGIAGTMTTLAAVAMEMKTYDGARVHGHVMTREEIARTVRMLAELQLADRQTLPGLEPKRADVIVAGGLIALACLEALGAESVTISDRGVRWGLAIELAK